jgi:Ni,Fe-hydrogenase maturation factor
MKIYVFGNNDYKQDKKAFLAAKKLKDPFPDIEFIEIDLNKDLPFDSNSPVVILDTVDGIERVELLQNDDLDKLITKSSTSVHDFDLGFQIQYLKKLGKLGKISIIGIPMKGKVDYLRIQLILRKLVAQDMQGS